MLSWHVSKKITKPSTGDADAPDLNRHQRKCEICRHPDREAIDEEFIHWHYPMNIAKNYQISRRTLYRHAHATGLIARRRENMRCALELIIDQAEWIDITGDNVIRAIHAHACLTDQGCWIEPPSHVVFSVAGRDQPARHGESGQVLPAPPQPCAPDNREIPAQLDKFLLIDTQAIRNDSNLLETKEATQV